MLRLSDPVSLIPNVNKAQRAALKKFELQTIANLLQVFPRRYDDYSRTTLIGRAPIDQPITVKGKIVKVVQVPGFRRRISMMRGVIEDESGSLNVIWFNQPWLLTALTPGKEVFLSGSIKLQQRFGRQMANPIWEPADDPTIAGSYAPVYPLRGSVAQKTIRELMATVIDDLEDPPDPLPEALIAEQHLLTLSQAYRAIHRPVNREQAEEGRRRFAFDEFFAYRLALGSTEREAVLAGAPIIPFDESYAKRFVLDLPFELSPDQKRAAWASFQDMKKNIPMRRLLQGDVGSGKTVVAAFLLAMAYRSGQSAVLMAPTELLAKQHANTLHRFLKKSSVPHMLVTSSDRRLWEGTEEKKLKVDEAVLRSSLGRIVLIGTHALLFRSMLPPDTALSIIDEQHRFGVSQRETLTVAKRPDGLVPHLLSMTATPIPRSLALTLYGDLNISVIRTKPIGRLEIRTVVLVGHTRDQAYDAIRSEAAKGHRAFIVCPLIEESDMLGVKSATEEAKRLASGPLKGLRIGLLHGRMSAQDKDGVMKEFIEGLLDVLVSTTVVEVGVDIPEATVMAIEGAERFGLAQLHQLRGRVGRSSHQSFCYLLTDAEGASLDRLRVLERTNDGFVIAEEDLARRGEGNLLGTQQSGQALFRLGRVTDTDLMIAAKEAANDLLASDMDLSRHEGLRDIVDQIRMTQHQE